jgi:putative IMPACT (imprinted ancient) family translation regulator
LGASGLITAYKTAAQDALEQATIITKSIQQLFEIEMDYERLPMMLEAIKNAEVTIIDKVFQASAKIVIAIGIDQIQRDWNQIATLFVGHDADQKELMENHDIKINTMQKRAI